MLDAIMGVVVLMFVLASVWRLLIELASDGEQPNEEQPKEHWQGIDD